MGAMFQARLSAGDGYCLATPPTLERFTCVSCLWTKGRVTLCRRVFKKQPRKLCKQNTPTSLTPHTHLSRAYMAQDAWAASINLCVLKKNSSSPFAPCLIRISRHFHNRFHDDAAHVLRHPAPPHLLRALQGEHPPAPSLHAGPSGHLAIRSPLTGCVSPTTPWWSARRTRLRTPHQEEQVSVPQTIPLKRSQRPCLCRQYTLSHAHFSQLSQSW